MAAPHKPLFRPLVPLKPGESKARKANTYRGAADRIIGKQPEVRYFGISESGKYSGAMLREIRKRKGVGRPIATG